MKNLFLNVLNVEKDLEIKILKIILIKEEL